MHQPLEMARINPELARLNPELARINPDLARLNPELVRLNPEMAHLAQIYPPDELACLQVEMARLGSEGRFNTLRGHLVPYRNCPRSSTSQHSRSCSQYISSDIEELTDDELVKLVNDLKHQIRVLNLENEVLEKAITRMEPSLMDGVERALAYAFKLHTSSSSLQLTGGSSFMKSTSRFAVESLASPSRILASPSRISARKVESSARMGGTIFGMGPRINVLERSELVSLEMEIIVENLEKARKKAAKQHALLKAQLEEIDVRVADVEKATESFNQQVIIEGYDRIAQRIPAEIWIRYMNEWVKICDSRIGKLRLRTSTLNTAFSKLTGQIKIKAELNENLRPVDFEKLKIENGECLKTIQRKMIQLVELKKMTGDANLNLTIHKKAMAEQNGYLTNVIESINTKERLTVEIDNERDLIEEKVEGLETRVDDLRKLRQAYEVPSIMEYVQIKAETADLRHACKMLENRVHVQQIALKSMNKKIAASMFFSKVIKY